MRVLGRRCGLGLDFSRGRFYRALGRWGRDVDGLRLRFGRFFHGNGRGP
jgi:hypothetical protein